MFVDQVCPSSSIRQNIPVGATDCGLSILYRSDPPIVSDASNIYSSQRNFEVSTSDPHAVIHR